MSDLNLFSFTDRENILISRIITNATEKKINKLFDEIFDNEVVMTCTDLIIELRRYLHLNSLLCLEIKESEYKFLTDDIESLYFRKINMDI